MGARGRRTPGRPPQLRPASVDDIVATDVVTAERDTPIATVVAMLAEEDVGSVVVVDDDSPVGILTDRQIALALEDTPDLSDETAEDLISDELVTATTDNTVFEALEQMRDEGVRRLPIVDDDGTLEGILTLDDVLVVFGTELSNATDIIKEQSPRL